MTTSRLTEAIRTGGFSLLAPRRKQTRKQLGVVDLSRCTCPECGCVVGDQQTHDLWHALLHQGHVVSTFCRRCRQHTTGSHWCQPTQAVPDAPRCSVGHVTTPAEPSQHLLPCGCTFETATTQALDDAGVPPDLRPSGGPL